MSTPKRILGIETSCDECSVSIVEFNKKEEFLFLRPLSVATHSQIDLHAPYGGVVPEIASRNHLETINWVVEKCFSEANLSFGDIDCVAATNRPGLVGALLVGVSAGKSISYALGRPFVPVHHLEGHIASLFLNDKIREASLPILVAVVSGGHTQLHVLKDWPENWPDGVLEESLVCKSRDDAAGEAFDKAAKMLGLGYPGGKIIDQLSRNGDRRKYKLPRSLPQKSVLEYSFSGLKTAISLLAKERKEAGDMESELPHLCASIQEAIIDTLISKIKAAQEKFDCKSLAVVGGVSANSRLREKLQTLSGTKFFPELKYCTDNAAMIAAAGGFRFLQSKGLNKKEYLGLTAFGSDQKYQESLRGIH